MIKVMSREITRFIQSTIVDSNLNQRNCLRS